MAGAVGGFAQSLVLCPIDVVKSKMQVMGLDPHHHYPVSGASPNNINIESAKAPLEKMPSATQVAREIIKARGIRGLYLGLLPTLYRDVIGYGFFFGSYEYLKGLTHGPVDAHTPDSEKSSPHSQTGDLLSVILAGGLAGVIYHASTHPCTLLLLLFLKILFTQPVCWIVDVVKSIVQTQPFIGDTPKYDGMIHCFQSVYKDAGLSGFSKGFAATMLRSVPASAAGWLVYELTQKIFPTNETLKE